MIYSRRCRRNNKVQVAQESIRNCMVICAGRAGLGMSGPQPTIHRLVSCIVLVRAETAGPLEMIPFLAAQHRRIVEQRAQRHAVEVRQGL